MDRPSSSPYPSRWKGRQTEVCIPRLSSISRDCLHTFSSLSRYGLGQSITRFGFMPLTSVLQLAVGRLHDLRQREVAGGSLPVTQDSPDIQYSPPVPGWGNKSIPSTVKSVFLRMVQKRLQHLQMHGRVPDHALFAHLFPARLKLRLHQADGLPPPATAARPEPEGSGPRR